METIEKRFNIFSTGDEEFFTPGKQLSYIAAAKPDADALIYITPENKEIRMSWQRLHELSNQIANYLIDIGICPGKYVIVALGNIPTHIALAFGIWKAGGCYVPVSNKTPKRNMMEICECLDPALVVTNGLKPSGYSSISSNDVRSLCASYSTEMPPDILAVPNLANLSGGTSGKVKVIQQNMPAGESEGGLKYWFSLSGMHFEMMQLLAGPLFHGAPHTAAFDGLYSGNTLILTSSFAAEDIVSLIKKYKVEYVQMVPTLMQRIVTLPDVKPEDFASIEAFCHTGGVCSADLKRRWFELVAPEKVYELYSMTECLGMTGIRGDEWLEHPGSVGRSPACEIVIKDEDGNPLPAGETGEIFMKWLGGAPKVELRNIDPIVPDENGYSSVGDMGYLDEEGYLFFADRRSGMIVTGGENVFSAEVETVLKKHKAVRDAVVLGLPDAEWGHRIHAMVETVSPVTDKELIRFALNYLPPYKMPKSFDFVDSIPTTESGKVVRNKLVEESLAKGF